MTLPFPHLEYAKDIVEGRIRASVSVIRQCRRTLEEHDRGFVDQELHGERIRFVYRPEKVRGRIGFINQCPHPAGKWKAAGETITLEPWQEFFISEVFGWVDETDERVRRYDEAILFVGRKNGKTSISATLALHEAAWGDAGSEVYCAATKSDQAEILWGTAKSMVESMNDRLSSLFRVTVNEIKSRQGVFKFLPSKSKTQDGLNPSLALIDESAAIEDANQIHVLESGMVSRDSPLTIHLTTAQPLRTTHFKTRYDMAKRGLESGKMPVSLFAMLYELDSPEEIEDPENWIKANPNLGVSITRRKLASSVEKSKENPREKSLTLCKNFNIWSQYATAWIPVAVWDACEGNVLREGDAYIGLDLAESRDLCAACIVWDNGGRYSVDWKFWTPRRSLDMYPEEDKAVLLRAATEGVLELSESPVVEISAVKEWVCDQYDRFQVRRIGVDPWHAKRLTVELEEIGYPILQVAQSMAKLTDPIKDVEKHVVSGAVVHPGYGLLQWMVLNVVAVTLKGVILSKPEAEPHRKIDGLDALVTAFACVDYSSGAFSLSDMDLEDLDMEGMPPPGTEPVADSGLLYV